MNLRGNIAPSEERRHCIHPLVQSEPDACEFAVTSLPPLRRSETSQSNPVRLQHKTPLSTGARTPPAKSFLADVHDCVCATW